MKENNVSQPSQASDADFQLASIISKMNKRKINFYCLV